MHKPPYALHVRDQRGKHDFSKTSVVCVDYFWPSFTATLSSSRLQILLDRLLSLLIYMYPQKLIIHFHIHDGLSAWLTFPPSLILLLCFMLQFEGLLWEELPTNPRNPQSCQPTWGLVSLLCV